MRAWTALAASLVEAWGELRVARTRVLLSLIGVAVAVAALTSVVAFGQIATQAQIESAERSSGRPATLQITPLPSGGQSGDPVAMDAAFRSAVERYGITYASRAERPNLFAQLPTGVSQIQMQVVDQPYGEIHRIRLQTGAWFVPQDAARLAPAIVINAAWWHQLGDPALASHPTVTLVGGEQPTTAVVIGVTPSSLNDTYPAGYLLTEGYAHLGAVAQRFPASAQYEVWVPTGVVADLSARLQRDLQAAVGPGWTINISRNDYLAYGYLDSIRILQLVIGGIAGVILLLGALGLLNISLVTVRYRIREIGIRRSFGATAGRVFFSVMMESVVATVVAGVVGVILSIFALKNPWVTALLSNGIADVPGFPVEAALVGLGAATLVGALAGLLPALVAVRVKVIDAIRY